MSDPLNKHREAAEYAAKQPGRMSFGDRVSLALTWGGMGNGLATASAYDAAQVGRYLGELTSFARTDGQAEGRQEVYEEIAGYLRRAGYEVKPE